MQMSVCLCVCVCARVSVRTIGAAQSGPQIGTHKERWQVGGQVEVSFWIRVLWQRQVLHQVIVPAEKQRETERKRSEHLFQTAHTHKALTSSANVTKQTRRWRFWKAEDSSA